MREFQQRLQIGKQVQAQRAQLAQRGAHIQAQLALLNSGAGLPARVVDGAAPTASPHSDASAGAQQPAAKARRAPLHPGSDFSINGGSTQAANPMSRAVNAGARRVPHAQIRRYRCNIPRALGHADSSTVPRTGREGTGRYRSPHVTEIGQQN